MRGYSQLIGDIITKNELTQVMHGYNKVKVDLNEMYRHIFGISIHHDKVLFSGEDIASLDLNDGEIVLSKNYPLLNRTLSSTKAFLVLRAKVEKKLSDAYKVNTTKNSMLTQIIHKAFSGKSDEMIEKRVFLFSKKTLLNEFNHFETNFNLYQPAIDINSAALAKEKEQILEFLDSL